MTRSRTFPVAQELAIRHVAYGAKARHYDAVGVALIETLRAGLGAMFDADTEAAWGAAYLWLLTDSMVDMASINGLDHETCWRARMCVHLLAAIWIAGASAGMTGPALVIGVPLGIGLLLHALFGPRLKNTRQVLGSFVVPGMVAWLASVAFYLGAFARG